MRDAADAGAGIERLKSIKGIGDIIQKDCFRAGVLNSSPPVPLFFCIDYQEYIVRYLEIISWTSHICSETNPLTDFKS